MTETLKQILAEKNARERRQMLFGLIATLSWVATILLATLVPPGELVPYPETLFGLLGVSVIFSLITFARNPGSKVMRLPPEGGFQASVTRH